LEDILAGIASLINAQDERAMQRAQMERDAQRTLAANMARSGQMSWLFCLPEFLPRRIDPGRI